MASTFASLIKDLSSAAPAELDPEDSYHSIDAKANKDDRNLTEYRPVSPSRLRNEFLIEEDPTSKYSGRRVTRKELQETASLGSETEDENEDEDEASEAQSIPSDGDQVSSTLDDRKASHLNSSNQLQPDPELLKFGPRPQAAAWSTSRQPDNDARDPVGPEATSLVRQLQASVKADINKGKAIKAQLLSHVRGYVGIKATYDRLLGLRIGMQKVLTATNELSKKMSEEPLVESKEAALEQLLLLSSTVGKLRAEMMQTNDSLEVPENLRRKRKADSDLNTCLDDAKELDKILSPHLRATVSKWSSKINAASSLSQQHKKFNAVNQNAMNQLDSLWAMPGEKDRLVERTRMRRATGPDKKTALDAPNQDIFDDRDFYHSLLKEVVDTNMRDIDPTSFPANRAQRTHRAGADPKASKGRKIRYHVHEKLVSFMVPIPTDLWPEEQKDELFASLLGRGFEQSNSTHIDPPAEQEVETPVGLGSLKLFG
ncbi:hypothetical protein CROQUDRAFT_132414 [Cronartium quercuum f. sp. fusiforme G11]|uniref:Protein BFR2 n=1 Tax=Cronartium quercuum f. sp. fusiforme G11 TaxID=708437 RepID=A0A9P6NP23_9BASI|nr:hypothetical protein CROQUDRAFT_132414 [Cronartium quercuum f. sp. fusiforme G11]